MPTPASWLVVRHTVQGYEQAGVAAIQLEDQTSEKCGHAAGRTVTSDRRDGQEGGGRRRESDKRRLPHHARIDARSSLGIDEAIAAGARGRRRRHRLCESLESRTSSHAVAEIDARCSPTWSKVASPVLADRLAELGVTIGLLRHGAAAVTAWLRRSTATCRCTRPTPGADMRSISDLHGLGGWTRFSSSRSDGTTDRGRPEPTPTIADQRSTTATSATNRTSGSGDQ